MVSHLPPLPPQPVQIVLPNPLQLLHFCQPGMVFPEPPQIRHGFLPLLQNVHFFHACLLDISVRLVVAHFKVPAVNVFNQRFGIASHEG